ncbi:Protein root UVB sensitive 4 [Bienertia sinuspersici]
MRNGRNYKYFWNGNFLELLCVDDENPSTVVQGFEVGIRKFLIMVKDFFIPKQVTENYIDYVKWKFLHRVFSSALQVLATQAMFRAIGVGYAQSLPSAAAMNWFKHWSRVDDPCFSRIGFLLLASVANIAKQISLGVLPGNWCKTAVHRSFALADNLGEVSAKSQACYIRQALLSGGSKWENIIEGCHISHVNVMKWFRLTQDSKSRSQFNLNTLHEQMLKLNWITKNILFGQRRTSSIQFW